MVIEWIRVCEREIAAIRSARASGRLVNRGDKPCSKEFRECLLDHVDCTTCGHAQPSTTTHYYLDRAYQCGAPILGPRFRVVSWGRVGCQEGDENERQALLPWTVRDKAAAALTIATRIVDVRRRVKQADKTGRAVYLE